MNNIHYDITELNYKNNDIMKKNIENEILSIVNSQIENNFNENIVFDNIISMQIYYEENYTKHDLTHIAHYYILSTKIVFLNESPFIF